MKIICIANSKGGTGKSTTTANLGSAIANMGKKVLIVDLDEQQSLTDKFNIDVFEDDSTCLMDCILMPQRISPDDIKIEITEFLDVLPVNGDKIRRYKESLTKDNFGVKQLKKVVDQISDNYDYIFIDTPGSKEIYTLMGLSVATDVIIPMRPNDDDMKSTERFLDFIEMAKQINPSLNISGILFTMTRKGNPNQEKYMKELFQGDDLEKTVFKTKIRNNIRIGMAGDKGNTSVNIDRSSNGAKDYNELAKEVLRWH